MSFAVTRKDLETVILREVRERQTSYGITYMWNLKKKMGTSEPTYKNKYRGTDAENKLMVTSGLGGGGGERDKLGDWD